MESRETKVAKIHRKKYWRGNNCREIKRKRERQRERESQKSIVGFMRFHLSPNQCTCVRNLLEAGERTV